MDTFTEEQIRSFRPVIVFHDSPSIHRHSHFEKKQHHQQNGVSTLYYKATNQDSLVETHKQRINEMLEANSKLWTNLINDTRQWEITSQTNYRPSSSSGRIPTDEISAISPTASTSTSSSSSGSSTSSSSLSSISSIVQPISSSSSSAAAVASSSSSAAAVASSSSSAAAVASSSSSFLPSITKYYSSQSHWKRQEYHQSLPMPSFIGSTLSLEQQNVQHMRHQHQHQQQQKQQQQHQQQHDQHLHNQMHMDTLCLDHLDKRRRGNLPKPVTAILKKWLLDHCRNPYPTEEEKLQLKNDTHLTLNQISNWFINARRRTLPIILSKLNHQYPGIKARRRRRRQRQDKPKRDNHSLNMTSPAEYLLG